MKEKTAYECVSRDWSSGVCACGLLANSNVNNATANDLILTEIHVNVSYPVIILLNAKELLASVEIHCIKLALKCLDISCRTVLHTKLYELL